MRENYSLVGNNEFDHVIGNCFRKKQGEINKFHFIFNKSLSFLLLLNIEKISCYSMIAKFWANASFSVHCFFFSCQTDFSIVGKYLKFLKKTEDIWMVNRKLFGINVRTRFRVKSKIDDTTALLNSRIHPSSVTFFQKWFFTTILRK